MDYEEVKGENEESQSQINNVILPTDINNNNITNDNTNNNVNNNNNNITNDNTNNNVNNNNNNITNDNTNNNNITNDNTNNNNITNDNTNNNNITNDNTNNNVNNNNNNVENVSATQVQDQNENQHNVTIENQTGGSVYIICQNDSSTISASSSALIVNIGQNPVVSHGAAGIHCNTSCLQPRVNQEAQTTTRNNTTCVRGRPRSPRWNRRNPRRRGHQRLQTSPELMNFQIAVGGSIRYWNVSPQIDNGINLYLPHERNAPPTYSPMMANTCPYDLHCSSFISPMPPPTYAQAVGATDMEVSEDPFLELRVSTLWSHARQPAYCFVCRVMIVTNVKHRISRFTHISVLILCFFGCWPCCIFPYCLNYFKTTYHYCPRCSTCLGVYSAFTN